MRSHRRRRAVRVSALAIRLLPAPILLSTTLYLNGLSTVCTSSTSRESHVTRRCHPVGVRRRDCDGPYRSRRDRDRPARARPAAGLDELLLDAKLSVPQLRPGMVSRVPLIETAQAQSGPRGRGHGARRVRQVDPAREWAGAEDRVSHGFRWTARRRSRRPARRARIGVRPDVPWGAGPGRRRQRAGCRRVGSCRARLASAFRTSPAPFVLMLDDLHELQSPACHDVLGVVITGIPPGSQLVTASRFEQPHLPRLRASGDALELGQRSCAGPGRCRADLPDAHVRVDP